MGRLAVVSGEDEPVGLFAAVVQHGWRRDFAMWNELFLALFARLNPDSRDERYRFTVGVIFHVPGRTWPETAVSLNFDSDGIMHRRFSPKLGWEVHVLLPGEDFVGDAWTVTTERLAAAVASVEARAITSGRAPGGLPTARALAEAAVSPRPSLL
jgi:hypothetical protein